MGPQDKTELDALACWGWDREWENAFESHRSQGSQPARVTAIDIGRCTAQGPSGEVKASFPGRLLQSSSAQDQPAVGDWVAIKPGGEPKRGVVEAVLPRRSQFTRQAPGRQTRAKVVAANIDTVFLMTAVAEDFNPRRLERYLVAAWESGASPVIVLTKSDLLDDLSQRLSEAEAVAAGVPVHSLSCLSGDGLEALESYLVKGTTLAMLGSSGVGKSTLINRFLGSDLLATAGIREADGRGRHTTTRQLLLALPCGALVIDTPGLRELKIWEADDGLQRAFQDIEEFAHDCRFGDCRHQREPGCAVQDALAEGLLDASRFANYEKLQRELEFQARRRDESLAREEKQRNKRFHKMARRIMNEKAKRWRSQG